jgi:hypothetical protein
LTLKNAIDRANKFDEFIDGLITFIGRNQSVAPLPFKLIKGRVLALFLPVEQEHVFEQTRQRWVGIDALTVMKLGEKL